MSAAATHSGLMRRIGDRLGQIWATPGWIVRAQADGLDFVLRPRPRSGALPEGAAIAGLVDAERFALVAPRALLDRLLAQSPDPIESASLDPADAALVYEHFMGGALAALERALGVTISFERVLPPGAATDADALAFEILTPEASYPCALFLPGREGRARVARALQMTVSWGPAVMPGQLLVIGPVALGEADIAGLRVGDTVLVEGSTVDRLQGAILFADGSGRPVTIAHGEAVLGDPVILDAGERAAAGLLDLCIGTTVAPAMPRPGAAVPFRANPEQAVLLRVRGRDVARGELVVVEGCVAVSITALEDAS